MTTPNMGMTLPTEGGDVGTWGTELNAVLTLVDAHDHTTGKGAKIPAAGLNIDGVLDCNGNRVGEIGAAQFNEVASATLSGIVRALWFNSSDHELYIRTNSGTDIKLTSGSTLNVAALSGIGGDYATAGALISYIDATKRYTFQSRTSPGKFADLYGASIKIHQVDPSTSSFGVKISVGAMAADYTLTLPVTLPGAGSLLQVDATGVVTYSNALPTNQSVTVSGTGLYKHGDRTMRMLVNSFMKQSGAGTYNTNQGTSSHTGVGRFIAAIPLDIGKRIKSVVLDCDRGGAGTINLALMNTPSAFGLASAVASGSASLSAGTGTTTLTISPSYTLGSSGGYDALTIDCSNVANVVGSLVITYDQP